VSSPDEQASALIERVYVAFTSMAVIVAIHGDSHTRDRCGDENARAD